MMKVLKKIGKWLARIVGAVLALVLVAVLLLPIWIGPTVTSIANSKVPEIVKGEFSLGSFYLNQYSGRLTVEEVCLANPEGYTERTAAHLGLLDVEFSTLSLFTDTVHIEKIVVSNLFVSVVYNADFELNFKKIGDAASGEGPKDPLGQQYEEVEVPVEEPPAEGEGKKVIIDRVEIHDLKVSFGLVTVPIPDIVLTDIGKDGAGVKMEEVWEQVLEAVKKNSKVFGKQWDKSVETFSKLGVKVLDRGSDAVESAKGLLKDASGTILDAGGSTLESGKKFLNGLFK